MTSPVYWLSFALVVAYFAVMVHCWRITHRPAYRQRLLEYRDQRLSRRLDPYHGALLARAQPEPDLPEDDLVSDWRRLRQMSPPHAQALVSKLESKALLDHALRSVYERQPVPDVQGGEVVPLHPGYSVKVG